MLLGLATPSIVIEQGTEKYGIVRTVFLLLWIAVSEQGAEKYGIIRTVFLLPQIALEEQGTVKYGIVQERAVK